MALEGQNNSNAIRDAMTRAKENSNQAGSNAQEEQGSRREQATGRRASLSQIGRANPTPLAMSNTAEVLEQFRRSLVEALPAKDDNNLINVTVHPIDASTAGIPFSLVVVAGTKRGKESLGVAHHSFLLAGSAEPLRPREESYRGKRLTIVQVAGDGYDSRTREVVKDVLQRHYGDVNLYSADAEVIHEGFPTYKEDPNVVADCVKNALAAIKTAIDRNDPTAVQLVLEEDDDAYNTIHVQHRQNHIFDRGHMPTRADVIIELHTRQNAGRNSRDSLEQLVTGTRISKVGGFYDIVYAPAEGANTTSDLFSRRDRRPASEDHMFYALRFVTTFVDTIDFSPNAMMLAMATVNAASDSNEVMRAFEPNLSVGEDDIRNIGALAIETNLNLEERGFSERFKTKESGFTTAKRMGMLKATIQPGMIHSYDVPECGAATWQGIDMMAVSQGNGKAMRRMYDAACVLTNGHFEDFYKVDDPIVDSHVERIHGGYYTEGTGGPRLDLRDFDYLALLNLLRPEKLEDLEVVQRWSMASAVNEETLMSQSDRYEIIHDFLPTAVVTHYYQRYNINQDFNYALMDAIAKCKLSLNPTSSGRDGSERFRTAYGNIDNILNRQSGSSSLYRNQRQGRDRFDDRYMDRSGRNFENRW